jgi:hypothetical protein
MPLTDWKGNPVVFEEGYGAEGLSCYFYPISAYKCFRAILKQYKYNQEVTFKKRGYRSPIIKSNVKGQIGNFIKIVVQFLIRKAY